MLQKRLSGDIVCMTADPSRLVAQLTSAGMSIAVFHVQFQNLGITTEDVVCVYIHMCLHPKRNVYAGLHACHSLVLK